MRRVIRDPSVRDGAPVLEGTRVPVADLLRLVAAGTPMARILGSFPRLSAEDVSAAVLWAADRVEENERKNGPLLSLVVVVYDMPEQAKRTLLSLSPQYQRNVRDDEYEVVVIENASSNNLGESGATEYARNVRYFKREETSSSPVFAVNFGVEQTRAPMVGIVVDGARMLTPGVVELALAARRITDCAVISVPGYHLGSQPQQEAAKHGYDERTEARLLESIEWPADGYRLFEASCLSRSCGGGVLQPYAESNCLCLPKALFHGLGGYDTRFDLPGGGYVNLDLYKRACEAPNTDFFVLPGEGTFHQFHGGVTTNVPGAERQALMKRATDQYEQLRGERHTAPDREPVYLGRIPRAARQFLRPTPARRVPDAQRERATG